MNPAFDIKLYLNCLLINIIKKYVRIFLKRKNEGTKENIKNSDAIASIFRKSDCRQKKFTFWFYTNNLRYFYNLFLNEKRSERFLRALRIAVQIFLFKQCSQYGDIVITSNRLISTFRRSDYYYCDCRMYVARFHNKE